MLYGKEHVERYRATGGEEGHEWQGTTTLILTTTGRTSGLQRSTPLIYRTDGGAYAVVASNGGAPDHPQWYKNLEASPEAEVQVKADRFRARARTATPEEKARLWPLMTEVWPQYDQYQERTDRDIPVVLLEPVG
ncbi:nitroreductase family deazaflavin-dependent oxidoreductase [Streptomonospora wellingtoniae]|uniref:Nitroreductase family deazaflavin-dependent oxidoreductase n=1 Tax=Streptomonospora wellingtoniae TaxID=3075544 RepID=A0ABU2KTS0_9ACTN|nr:nitroreductase family deazaflavin-dependent oxidoreductase [Streptomonospora sp. DSM 45055]MDT0302690.1 nitroreductase family deazaflavin-dependent oxidoreductase [Streptomonospora sp. DSM 45055]